MATLSVARKLGRTPRTFNPRVPHMSALLAGKALVAPPASIDHSKGMPGAFGMMLNDQLGDCTCAALDHRQGHRAGRADDAGTGGTDAGPERSLSPSDGNP